MPSQLEATKDVVSCEKLRGAASERRSADIRMGKPAVRHPLKEAKLGKGNILVPRRKEINRDSLSSGERTGKSPNTYDVKADRRCRMWVEGTSYPTVR